MSIENKSDDNLTELIYREDITDTRSLVKALLGDYRLHEDIIQLDRRNRVDRQDVIAMIKLLRLVLFPGYFDTKLVTHESLEYYVGDLLEEFTESMTAQIEKALRHASDEKDICADKRADNVMLAFMKRLPAVRDLLATDVEAAFDGDPAAAGKKEIILTYPGLFAIMVNRIAHELFLLGVPLIPRIMTEYAHSRTGIDIHPGASIGHHFFIDHGTGIVVGETTEIGNYVKIYQGVTLGAHSTRGGQALSGTKRHPTVHDNVTIYAGASILGGTTVIGEGVVIGSNAFITKSVSAMTRVSTKNPELNYNSSSRKHSAQDTENEASGYWYYTI
ncbi:MAG: serine acetyltransferase [Clostridiales Family XIII bacterium]|nr:serine acetyltransferase [Clostridiales Family XIII bacterium]